MNITRLAPSPTGALHLGNARTFLVNWLLARQRGWRIMLRIDDLDGPRIKHGADRQAMNDLRWLGIDWDDGPVYQSHHRDRYRSAITQLLANQIAYPCICSRKEVDQASSAPHAEDGSTTYPGTCRDRFASIDAARRAGGKEPAIRFDTRGQSVEFIDQFAGTKRYDVDRNLGDFVIAKGDAAPAYQLAVVVDDADEGVSDVVRGDDLLDSTPRQILVYRALGLADRVPRYWHLPLVTGTDGRRLAKRHGDTRLSAYREQGIPPGRVLSLLASWCGISAGELLSAGDLIGQFNLANLPKTPIVFDPRGKDAARLECAPK